MSKPPSRPTSKSETPNFKASSLYESWMDGGSIKSIETRETATPLAQRKQRSNFKFDKGYADAISLTPVPHSPIPSPLPNLADEKVFTTISKIPRTPPTQQNLHKPTKAKSRATSPLIFAEEDYSEFFEWIFNGNEDDINPEEIERMLFKTPKKSKTLLK